MHSSFRTHRDPNAMDIDKQAVSIRASNTAATFTRTALFCAALLLAATSAYAAPVPGGNANGNRFILCNDGHKVMWPSDGDYHLLARQCSTHGGVKTTGNNANPNGIFPAPPPPPRNLSAQPIKPQIARDLKAQPLPDAKP